MPDSKTLIGMLLLVSTLVIKGDNDVGGVDMLTLDVWVISNTFDESTRLECEVWYQAEANAKQETWVAFGRVRPQREHGWDPVSSNTRCGLESFEKTGAVQGGALRIPYIIVGIETIADVDQGGKIDLRVALDIRKLSAFDENAQPIYTHHEQKRRFDLRKEDYAIVPILVEAAEEKNAFNVNELFIRVGARVLGCEMTAYGTISVATDVPGVDIFLDGGLVGRTLEKGPTVLRNVLVGRHEVEVRDFSGRAASKLVTVNKDQTVKVGLKLLNLARSVTQADLVHIGKNQQGYNEYWRVRDAAVVVTVPGGEFVMGSADDDGEPSERPQQIVSIKEFLMDKTEVTWRQFRKFAEATESAMPPAPLWGTPEDYAVSGVLFDEAKAYCEWVGGRLPTEAEWEKAARGTDGRVYPWGNDWDPNRCNSLDGGPHRPEPVGSFPDCLSPYGIVDMAGSVLEWCADWYAEGYLERVSRDPKGPAVGKLKILRGGSWLYQPNGVRTAFRQKSDPAWRNVHHGFRCAQSVPQ